MRASAAPSRSCSPHWPPDLQFTRLAAFRSKRPEKMHRYRARGRGDKEDDDVGHNGAQLHEGSFTLKGATLFVFRYPFHDFASLGTLRGLRVLRNV